MFEGCSAGVRGVVGQGPVLMFFDLFLTKHHGKCSEGVRRVFGGCSGGVRGVFGLSSAAV